MMVGAPIAVFVVASTSFLFVSADIAFGVLLSDAAVQHCHPLVFFLQHPLRPLVHLGVRARWEQKAETSENLGLEALP